VDYYYSLLQTEESGVSKGGDRLKQGVVERWLVRVSGLTSQKAYLKLIYNILYIYNEVV
jgi:hypothetical protein